VQIQKDKCFNIKAFRLEVVELKQKYIRVRFDVPLQNDFPLCVEDTEVHTLGVEINSTEKFVLLGVKSHIRPPFGNIFLGPESYPKRYDSRGP